MAQVTNENCYGPFSWSEERYNWYIQGGGKLNIESSSAIPFQIVFVGPENDTIEKVQQVFLRRNEEGGNGGLRMPWDPSQLGGHHVWPVEMMERYVNILPEQQNVTVYRCHSNNPPIGISYGIYDYLFIDGFTETLHGCGVCTTLFTNYGGPPIGGYIVLVARNEERATMNRCLGLDHNGRIDPLSLPSCDNNNNNNNRELSKNDSSLSANMVHPDFPRELRSEIMQFLTHPIDIKARVFESFGNVNSDNDDDIEDFWRLFLELGDFSSDHDINHDNYNGDNSDMRQNVNSDDSINNSINDDNMMELVDEMNDFMYFDDGNNDILQWLMNDY